MIKEKCACVCGFAVAVWIRGAQPKIHLCAKEISMLSTELNAAALLQPFHSISGVLLSSAVR